MFLSDFIPKIDFFLELFLPDSEEPCVDKPGFGYHSFSWLRFQIFAFPAGWSCLRRDFFKCRHLSESTVKCFSSGFLPQYLHDNQSCLCFGVPFEFRILRSLHLEESILQWLRAGVLSFTGLFPSFCCQFSGPFPASSQSKPGICWCKIGLFSVFPHRLQATFRVTNISICGTYPAFMINRISCLLPLLVAYMFACHLRQIKNSCRIHLIRYASPSIPKNFCFHYTRWSKTNCIGCEINSLPSC